MDVVDVRILVEGVSDVEVVSRALKGLTLGGEYGITVSSIIPTTSLEVAKRASEGADLLIVATDADKVGRELADRFLRELEREVGCVERMRLPMGHDLEHVDVELVRKELKNALVRAGLRTLKIIREYKKLKNELDRLKLRLSELEARPMASGTVMIEDAWRDVFPGVDAPTEKDVERAVLKLGLAGKVIVGQGYLFSSDPHLTEDLFRAIYLSRKIGANEEGTRDG